MFKSLLSIFRSPAKADVRHIKGSLKERCIQHLVCHKSITTLAIHKMGSCDERNVIYDLRREGYLLPVDHPKSFIEVRKGKVSYRIHRWSGKVPPEWASRSDRRTKPRGGRS